MKKTQDSLDILYQFALGACQEIDSFKPDLLVSLAHSDSGPMAALNACWQTAHPEPLPPTVRINFGLEKDSSFTDFRQKYQMGGYDSTWASTMDVAHRVTWFGQQEDWCHELLEILTDVANVPAQPQRILLLDEYCGGKSVYYAAFGLLHGVFPAAEIRFIYGITDWARCLGEDWLELHAPAFLAELQKDMKENFLNSPYFCRGRFPTPLHEALKNVMAGSEDIDPLSLRWQKPTAQSPAVQTLREKGLALDLVLGCSAWVMDKIGTYMVNRLACEPFSQEMPVSQEIHSDEGEIFAFNRILPDPELIALGKAWTPSGITTRHWAEIHGISMKKARRQLKWEWQHRRNVQPRGFGKSTVYLVEASSAPRESEESREIVYWAQEYHLLAGPCDYYLLFDILVPHKVTHVLDLTTYPLAPPDMHYFPNPNPDWGVGTHYGNRLAEEAAEKAYALEILNIPLQPFQVPSVSEMQSVLDVIDRVLAQDGVLFVHDIQGGERVGMVLGCWRVRHGWDARLALHDLQERYLSTGMGYRLPGTEAQRRFVLKWQNGM